MQVKQCRKVFFVLLMPLLIFLILCSLIAVSPIFATDGTNEVWELDVGRNISGLAVVDGKVFTTTHASDLLCLDQQNGQTLWTYNFGEYSRGGFLTSPIVAECKVFVGSRGSVLNCLDENNGSILWQFTPNLTSSFASKTVPHFSVAAGKVFTTGDGFYVLDASGGKLLWGYENYKSVPDFVGVEEWVIADNHVFTSGSENASWYLYSFNADDGRVLWKVEMFRDPHIVVNGGRILVWNYDESQTVLCLNETDGSTLWSYDVGATVFQPTLSNGLVLFGASNGNFYALNESEGTLKWKYETGYQNPKGKFDFATAKIAYDQVFTGYVDAQLGLEESAFDEHYKYEGYVYSLNLSNGLPNWATNISNTAWGGGSIAIQRILLNIENRTLYATTYADLYSLNVNNGTIQSMLHFDYWVLPPIYAYDKLFVAADLKVIAYGEAEPAKKVLRSLMIAAGIIAVGAAVTVVVYWLRRRRELISNAHA